MDILSRFIEQMTDDGEGLYEFKEIDMNQMFLFIRLNNPLPEKIEKWILLPIILPSLSTSLGLSDAQNLDLSWQQGDGKPLLYSVPFSAL